MDRATGKQVLPDAGGVAVLSDDLLTGMIAKVFTFGKHQNSRNTRPTRAAIRTGTLSSTQARSGRGAAPRSVVDDLPQRCVRRRRDRVPVPAKENPPQNRQCADCAGHLYPYPPQQPAGRWRQIHRHQFDPVPARRHVVWRGLSRAAFHHFFGQNKKGRGTLRCTRPGAKAVAGTSAFLRLFCVDLGQFRIARQRHRIVGLHVDQRGGGERAIDLV